MAFSFSADVTVLGNKLHIAPNPKVPTRIESTNGFELTGTDIATLTNKLNVPSELENIIEDLTGGTSLSVSQIVIDAQTKEFQVAISVQMGSDFFLNQFNPILEINDLHAFISVQQKKSSPAPATKTS